MKNITGTREWAVANANAAVGCSNGCRYCYARAHALRYGLIECEADWSRERVDLKAIDKAWKRHSGPIMYPSRHDITPPLLMASVRILRNILEAGNRVIVVSKPHLSCVQHLCHELESFRQQINFRFTISTDNIDLLRYWEPNAPHYTERMLSLQHAFESGFQTSVSAEPCLDWAGIAVIYGRLESMVTDTFWIGLLNKPEERVRVRTEEDQLMLNRLLLQQDPDQVAYVYRMLKDEPKIRWKCSVKALVGLPPAPAAGLNI